MNNDLPISNKIAFWVGVKEATPLLGGYIPVAISFGLVATQSGFSALEATLISLLIYAGASQFLLVAMVASGASLWLATIMTLLINLRHLVYAPNLSPWLCHSRYWWILMHGLTDQIFAIAHTRLPEIHQKNRMAWYSGASLLAWLSWVSGTALGAIAGAQLTQNWPLLAEIMPFALPALFLVLLAPKFTSIVWNIALVTSIAIAFTMANLKLTNLAIPFAAICGAVAYYLTSALIMTKDRRL